MNAFASIITVTSGYGRHEGRPGSGLVRRRELFRVNGDGRAVADPTELWRQWFEAGTRAWSDFFEAGRGGYADPYGMYRQWYGGLEEMRSRMVGGPTRKAPGGATGMEGRSPVEKAKPVPAVNPLANAGIEGAQNLWRQWYEAVSESAQRSVSLGTEVAGMWPRWFEALEQVRTNLSAVENVPTDPLQFVTQWYNATNGPFSDLVSDLIEREEFLEQGSRLLQNYASFYKVFKRNSEEYLRNLQIPVREDVTRVAGLVVALDDKMDRLEEAFEDFEDGRAEPATAAAVASIEERIAGLEEKLDGANAASEEARAGAATADSVVSVEKRLAGLEDKLDGAATAFDGTATAESVETLGGRLDRVEDKLDRLLAALEAPSRNGDDGQELVAPALSEAPQEPLPANGDGAAAPAEPARQEPRATAAARRKAAELGVDLAGVEGTGADGQITVGDVREAGGES